MGQDTRPLGLFEGFGIELEYMIVDRTSLGVRPISDLILHSIAGEYASEVEVGELAWSNELVLHVIELKTNGPSPRIDGLSQLFHRDISRINQILEPLGARLMPTGMHPWMDPMTETRLWPHEYNRVYEAFDRIFDCRGHGWSNLQSMHINLPFDGDDEFGRLHAAIRCVLPILPALAASSPFADGVASGFLDTRLDFYRRNCARVPSVTGHVVPERVFTEDEYQTRLLRPLYDDIRRFDPEGVLQHEWLNARGAIARFDRNTIEIRLLDIQECPSADLAVAAVVVGLIRALVEERWLSWERQKYWPEDRLSRILDMTIREGGDAQIADLEYLRDMGAESTGPVPAGTLWEILLRKRIPEAVSVAHAGAIDVLLREGTLARRMRRAWDGSRTSLEEICRRLCECLRTNRMFGADV